MTQKRRDRNSTEFGLWLREQKEIDSSFGYVTTNIDYVWENYKTGQWMLIEEKRHGSKLRFYQERIFTKIAQCAKQDPNFNGFHVITFENTNPEDGKIFIDGKEVSKEELLNFLRFK